jgi:zinc resistance-associated protein
MWWKTLFAATIALLLAGTCLANAQQPAAVDKASAPPGAKRSPLEDRTAIVDARVNAHKAGLKLTPEQEKNWPAYEAALRKLARLRVERHQELKQTNPVELLRERAEDLSNASVALKQLADAEEQLLNSLDDTQKHLLSAYAGDTRDRSPKKKD